MRDAGTREGTQGAPAGCLFELAPAGGGGAVTHTGPPFQQNRLSHSLCGGRHACLLLNTPVASHCSAVGPQKGGGTQKKGREAGLLFRWGCYLTPPLHFFWLPSSRPPLPSLRAPHPARTPAQCAPVMKVRPPGARQGTRRVGVSLGGMGAHHDAHPPAQKRSARAARPPATPISRSRRGRAVERRPIGVPAGPGARRQVLGRGARALPLFLRLPLAHFDPLPRPPAHPASPAAEPAKNPRPQNHGLTSPAGGWPPRCTS